MRKELEQSGERPARYKFPMYRVLLVVLLLALAGLQFQLWVADGSMAELQRLQETKQELKSAVEQARARNKALAAEIENLQSGKEAMIGRARSDVGMVKKGETFYLTVPAKADASGKDENADDAARTGHGE